MAQRAAAWSNECIAAQLRRAAELLHAQHSNPFRVNAYRHAADVVLGLDRPVREILERGGPQALVALPGIGRGIAAAIVEIVATGRWSRLERLSGEVDPVALLGSVPGLGPRLAARLHDELHVDSLEGLERVLDDGRAAAIEGLGPRRLDALRASVAAMLGPPAHRQAVPAVRPPVRMLLDVDAEYRRRARAGELPRIAPRRSNPRGEAWLPVLHTHREDWHFTALHSNTRRAHELGRTRDWVVIYCYDGAESEQQCTVVTERRGPRRGQRVVRGRESECAAGEPGAQPAAGRSPRPGSPSLTGGARP